jgi:hypothetical protein
VKVPVPSASVTITLPLPPLVTVGPEWKNTSIPVTVEPSGVPIGCAIRFVTVMSA